ncbi:sucrose transporter 4 [Dorcoceras hygrometricum]|uniref:Sucrose transporter 4 n=1 Tax=Dorcoceras hygrometricum TaxID=472368 RepID=A0A2Z7CNL7_9LAMI|nr:sucrose transporter 4 [Dorcoceras hygrometricum]
MPVPELERRTSTPSKHRGSQRGAAPSPRQNRVRLRTLFRVASVGCGIQFGWALQLSLLTPYVQQLGIPHAFASIIWLCGPLSGLVVQPLVGHLSDRCTSRFGRRRPFILAGAVAIVVSVLIIGHSADVGWLLGDTSQKRTGAVVVFVIGFWLLDVANNMIQGPCRALLADLTGKDHRRTRIALAYFSLFMAVGNVLGFATGSVNSWYKIFPFTRTSGCNISCANLKAAFLIDIIFILATTFLSLSAADEQSFSEETSGDSQEHEAFLWELFGTFRSLPGSVWIILFVTVLTWIGWFPFFLFDTDWMGREIYGGDPNEGTSYNAGVSMGSLGLMLNSVLLGITSVFIEKLCRKLGAGFTWGVSNILMSLCFLAMLIITAVRSHLTIDGNQPPDGIVAAALIAFALLGIPLAITYSVPYALVATRVERLGLGQGLSMGVLNLAIVVPQVIVSLGSGPWDQLFGGGNSPAFAVASISAFAAGLVAILAIPRTRMEKSRSRH